MNGAAKPWMRWGILGGGVALAAGAGLVLYCFDPMTAGFYPVCPLHEMTGLDCPGCGTLRALHALTHGQFAAAWRFNAFFVTMLPFLLWLGLRELVRLATGLRWPGVVTRPVFGWIAVAGIVVWGIARNIPFLIHYF